VSVVVSADIEQPPETRETDLTVDVRDAVGDRLMLTGGLRRDGVC